MRRTHRNCGAVAIPLVFGLGGQAIGGWLFGTVGAVIGGFAGSYLGSLLFPQSADDGSLPKAGSFSTQMTLSGSSIPISYGKCKVAGNVIILGDPHPYTIKHKARGGKGLGTPKTPDTEEIRYRRSFLIGICEGPADVGAIWSGKDQISIGSATIFRGDGNVGLVALTGKEFSHYKNLCCAYFQEYDIGSSDALPMFTFEVNTQPVYMFDFYVSSIDDAGSPLVQSFHDDGSLDKTFASAGLNLQTAYNIIRHTNGFIYYTVDDILYKCDADGNLITSFGGSGTGYMTVVGFTNSRCNTLREDETDGYLYACGESTLTHPHVFKIDPDTGTKVWSVYENWPSPNGCVFYDTELYITSCSAYGGHPRIIEVKNKSDGATIRTITSYTDGITKLVIDQDIGVVYGCGILTDGYNVWRNVIPDTAVNPIAIGGQNLNTIEIFTLTGSPLLTTIYVGGVRDAVLGASLYGIIYRIISGFFILYKFDTGGTVYKIMRLGGYLFVLHDLTANENGDTYNMSMFDLELNFIRGWVLDTVMTQFLCFTLAELNNKTLEVVQTWNPIDIQKDLITNTRYGGGISSSLINNESAQLVWQHCDDNDIGLAMMIDRRQPLLDWLDYIMSHYFGYMRLG